MLTLWKENFGLKIYFDIQKDYYFIFFIQYSIYYFKCKLFNHILEFSDLKNFEIV